jgi:hypothetical protein
MNRDSLVFGIIFMGVLLIVGRSCLVEEQGFRPFVEANALQHFLNQWEGVKLELGEAIYPPPTEEDVRRVLSGPPRASLSQGNLVRSDFQEEQRQFYLLVKDGADKRWLVIDKSQTDYEGLKRVWLARVSEGLLWRTFSKGNRVEKVVILGAAGNKESARLSDREVLKSLPETLLYTKLHAVSLRRH